MTNASARPRPLQVSAALNYWWTLESLNFSEIPKIDAAKHVRVIRSDEDWPWRTGRYGRHKVTIKGNVREFAWRHVVYLGVMSSSKLVEDTFTVFGEEIPDLGGKLRDGSTALAALVVDDAGCISSRDAVQREAPDPKSIRSPENAQTRNAILSPDSIVFSTLPWAMARLDALARGETWDGGTFAELCVQAIEDIEHRFSATKQPAHEQTSALTIERAESVLNAWRGATKWKGKWNEIARVQSIRVRIRDSAPKKLDPPLLNSFYLEDLERVTRALASGEAGTALNAYLHSPLLTETEKEQRADVRRFQANAETWLHPSRWALGAWPHKGGHSLVYAQQCAVNAIWGELSGKREGVFAVNGPPGTGKTTLLGDLVAAVISARAEILAELPSARAAFGEKVRISEMLTAFPTSGLLHGHEIVVASANNGAVENVTRELPALKKVDAAWFASDSGSNYRHFADIATAMLNPHSPTTVQYDSDEIEEDLPEPELPEEAVEGWGLIAAVLGNARNRSAFARSLWFETDASKGFRASIDEQIKANGRNLDAEFGDAQRSFKEAVATAKALRTRAERCAKAVATCQAQEQEVETMAASAAELEVELSEAEQLSAASTRELSAACQQRDTTFSLWRIADAALKWLDQYRTAKDAEEQMGSAQRASEEAARSRDDISARVSLLQGSAERQSALRASHRERRPVFWTFWFRRPVAVQWEADARAADEALRQAFAAVEAAEYALHAAEAESGRAENERNDAERKCSHAAELAAARLREVDAMLVLAPTNSRIHALLDGHPVSVPAVEDEYRILSQLLRQQEQTLANAKRKCELLRSTLAATKAKHLDAVTKRDAARRALAEARSEVERTRAGRTIVDTSFRSMAENKRSQLSPWIDEDWRKARIMVFLEALKLHRAFIRAAWRQVKSNLNLATEMLSGRFPPAAEPHRASVWATLFLITPVVSTTFASMDRLFRGIGRNGLGWLIIDEAGQATPQMAAGGVWRARRAVVVGDPYQIKPVVTLPKRLVELLRNKWDVDPSYVPGEASVQRLADEATRWGAHFGVDHLWVGCPLVVHRRCTEPMFGVANEIAYGKAMVNGRNPDLDFKDLFGQSAWVNVEGCATRGNWVEEEGQLAVEMAQLALQAGEQKSLFFITPFRSVANELSARLYDALGDGSTKWIDGSVGTVHTFQGKENSTVVLVLGGDIRKPGVRSFAADEPNLLNVALTRAKERIYVIGNARFWTEKVRFHTLQKALNPEFSGTISPERFRRNWRPPQSPIRGVRTTPVLARR